MDANICSISAAGASSTRKMISHSNGPPVPVDSNPGPGVFDHSKTPRDVLPDYGRHEVKIQRARPLNQQFKPFTPPSFGLEMKAS